MNRRILEHFGVEPGRTYLNVALTNYNKDICNCIADNGFLAVIGESGAGKTELIKQATIKLTANPDSSPIFVNVLDKNKENMNISSVLTAIVRTLSDESPRHSAEARAYQVIRLMGEKHVRNGKRICLIINEAHRVHANTLRALKELREDTYKNVAPLLSTILVGQEDLLGKLSLRNEVFYRIQLLEMNEKTVWTYFERVNYLHHKYGHAIATQARERIAAVSKTPLQIDFIVESKMQEAYTAGMSRLEADCFELSAGEMLNAINAGVSTKNQQYVSLQNLAEETGMSKTKIHTVLSQGGKKEDSTAVRDALDRLAKKRAISTKSKVA